MFTRIYIDNYKCFVNFEVSLNSLNLLMGGNGSGKSTVFKLILQVQSLITGREKLSLLFPANSCTRWQDMELQRFELGLTIDGEAYCYILEIEHDINHRRVRIAREEVLIGQKPIFRFEKGTVYLFRDDFSSGPSFPFDWTQSGLLTVNERNDNTRLIRFKKLVEQWIVVQINPTAMKASSEGENPTLSPDMSNFVSWLRYLSAEHQDLYIELVNDLQDRFEGFRSFLFTATGEDTKSLRLLFGDKKTAYRFDELSDGQRCLIALETLFHCTPPGTTLCIDEPENYLALPEIQPWLLAMEERCTEGTAQLLAISHHPEYINLLAHSHGLWFERTANGPVRVRSVAEKSANGELPIAELVARGWLADA